MRANDTSRPRALPLGPRMLPLPMDTTVVPEWDAARVAVRNSYARAGAMPAALRACLDLEIYTQASATQRRFGGPIGFAAVAVGFARSIDQAIPQRPAPDAYHEIAGCVAADPSDTLVTSGARGHVAALLAALVVLQDIAEVGPGCAIQRITIWSNSAYVAQCANGARSQNRNIDLWLAYDSLLRGLPQQMVEQSSIRKIDAGAALRHNRAAGALATNMTRDTRARSHEQDCPAPAATCTRTGGSDTCDKPTRATPPIALQADAGAKEQGRMPVTEEDDGEEKLAALRQLGVPVESLPALIGDAPTQLRQAGEIRSAMLADIVDEYKSFREELDEQQGDGALDGQEAMRQRQWCDRCVVAVLRQVDARWWLDRQEYEGWRLVRIAAQKSR